MHDLDLRAGQIGQVAAHVVEQNRQIDDTHGVEIGELAGQVGLGDLVEAAVDLERAETHAESHAQPLAFRCQIPQRLQGLVGVRLPPPATEEGVGLGGVEIEAVTVRGQEGDRLRAFAPRPWPTVEALDKAEVDVLPSR